MKTRCPACHTVYEVEPQALQEAQGLARCFRCGEVFNAFEHTLDAPPPATDDVALELDESRISVLDETPEAPPAPSSGKTPLSEAPGEPPTSAEKPAVAKDGAERPLPFGVPEDLEELQPSPDVALDTGGTLQPRPPRRSPWWQKLLALLLLLTLLAQLAWIRRDLWIHLPQATQLCAVLDCELREAVRPQDFHILKRDLEALPGPPPTLRLWLVLRNDAPFPQPLPRLQLSLLDANGTLVARRLFSARQYLSKDWPNPLAALPGEVITIELKLKDPGERARGFAIELL